jgi:GrpB-like predicted nucleotidyltransferase (UPF0157 family)
MRVAVEFSKKYFDQFRITPLKLVPFDPRTKIIANRWISELQEAINDPNVEIVHRGSTLFGICGKGDIDIAIYVSLKQWAHVLERLKVIYGVPAATGRDFAAFNLEEEKYQIEISLMKGYQIKVDKALTKFFLTNKDALKEYENLKKKYCFSKREYLIQRDKYLREIIHQL